MKNKPTKSESAKRCSATRLREREKETRGAYRRRRIGSAIWLLAELPLFGEFAVRKVVHHVGDLMARHLLGAHSARIELAAHLTDQMRPALEWKNPARDERGQKIGPRQALRLDHHPQSGDGGVSCLRQRHSPEGPLGQPARRWAGYLSRQVDVVAPRSDVPHVEV